MTPSGGRRKLAVVTAACGAGRAIAERCVERGYDLLIAVPDDGLETATDDLARDGATITTIRTDLSTYHGVETLLTAIASDGRSIDMLVFDEGLGMGGSFRETDLAGELRLVDRNLKTMVHLVKRVTPMMVAAGHGEIVFPPAYETRESEAVYGAAGAFVASFARALRSELRGTHVVVTVP